MLQGMGSGQYHHRIINLPVPRIYRPLIEEEMEGLGAFTIAQVMDHILGQYFGDRAKGNGHQAAAPDPATIEADPKTPSDEAQGESPPIEGKREESHEKSGSKFVPYLRS